MVSNMKRIKQALSAVAITLLQGCSMEEPKTTVSNDLAKLRDTINLQIPTKSARWEIFGTPEYQGGVPGPTDYITLVAELQSDKSWFDENKSMTGETFIAPEAARPWLTSEFRQILEKNKNSNVDLSGKANCRKFSTILKKTGKPVEGFVCGSSDSVLLYLTLWSEH